MATRGTTFQRDLSFGDTYGVSQELDQGLVGRSIDGWRRHGDLERVAVEAENAGATSTRLSVNVKEGVLALPSKRLLFDLP